jgi:hypothetical protein
MYASFLTLIKLHHGYSTIPSCSFIKWHPLYSLKRQFICKKEQEWFRRKGRLFVIFLSMPTTVSLHINGLSRFAIHITPTPIFYTSLLPADSSALNRGFNMRTALFWVITQRVVVIRHRLFGTAYRTGCLERSVRDYHYSLPNNPEERGSHLLRGGNPKSPRGLNVFLTCIQVLPFQFES